jgi:hypothetical protein
MAEVPVAAKVVEMAAVVVVVPAGDSVEVVVEDWEVEAVLVEEEGLGHLEGDLGVAEVEVEPEVAKEEEAMVVVLVEEKEVARSK